MSELPEYIPDDTPSGDPGAPPTSSGDWARIADFAAGHTDYKLVNFSFLDTSQILDLGGTYTVLAVSATEITLSNPALVNSDWDDIGGIGDTTAYASPFLSTSGERWIGPFTVDLLDLDRVLANFIAPQGLYGINKKGVQVKRNDGVTVEITPLDENNDPSGPAETFLVELEGSDNDKDQVGVSLWATPSFTGKCRIRARRHSPTDLNPDHTTVDQIKWRDCWGLAEVPQFHFGDVTTVHTRTYATSGATSTKERKLNCRVTRKVLERNEDDTFGPALVASTSAADIICHMALDPYIGGRSLAELDVPQIYDTVAEIVDYFGIAAAGTFNYTFDQDNISFEEMVQTVATAVFSAAYRQGSVLRLFFERRTNDSVLLFNHRNKVPGSERRTVTFGRLNDYDGVDLDYISPADGAKLTLYAPEDGSAAKPKKVEILGVQDSHHAFLHLMRAYNKLRYQHTVTQFNAMGEASQLILNERIEVTDNTRSGIFDGDIQAQDGLVLELSQPFTPEDGVDYVIHLQLSTGVVEVIDLVPGDDEWHIVLQAAPSEPLVVEDDRWLKTTFQIVAIGGTERSSAFLLTEKGGYDRKAIEIQAINYDARYYGDDFTFAVASASTADSTLWSADNTDLTADRA